MAQKVAQSSSVRGGVEEVESNTGSSICQTLLIDPALNNRLLEVDDARNSQRETYFYIIFNIEREVCESPS